MKGMRFDDIIKQPGSDRVVMTMGASFRDVNNDGLREIYTGAGTLSHTSLAPEIHRLAEVHELAKEILRRNRQAVLLLQKRSRR